MEMQNQSNFLSQQRVNQSDKLLLQQYSNVIVFLGDAGQGKSCLTKMLVQQSEKCKIICSQQAYSVTNYITAYKLGSQVKKKLGFQQNQKIILLDTPGLNRVLDDSFSGFKAVGLLVDILKNNKFNLLSIIYVISLQANRPFDEKGNNRFFQFFKLFPLALQNKLDINFTIFTNADRVYQFDAQEKIKTFYQGIAKFKLNLSKRHIQWMSQPQKEKQKQRQVFLKRTRPNGDLYQKYQQQWIKLGAFLKENMKKKCSPQILTKNEKKFQNEIYTEILKQLEDIQNINSSFQQLDYFIDPSLFPIPEQTNDILTNASLRTIGAVFGGICLQSALLSSAIITGGLVAPIAFFGLTLAWAFKKKSEISQYIKSFFKGKSSQKINLAFDQQMQKQCRQLALKVCEKKIAEQFIVKHDSCYLKKRKWIQNVKASFTPLQQWNKPNLLERFFTIWNKDKLDNVHATVQKKRFQNDQQISQYYCVIFQQRSKANLKLGLKIPNEKKLAQIVKKTGQDMFYNFKHKNCTKEGQFYQNKQINLSDEEMKFLKIEDLQKQLPAWKKLYCSKEYLSQVRILSKKMFQEKIQQYRCPITHFVMREPAQVKCCKKYFENVAICLEIDLRKKCPLCRSNLDQKMLITGYDNIWIIYDNIEMLRLQIQNTFLEIKNISQKKQWQQTIDSNMGVGYVKMNFD